MASAVLQSAPLQQLMAKGQVWHGSQSGEAQQQTNCLSTGSTALDIALHGGWQLGQLHEVQCSRWFAGELALMLPAMQWAAEQQLPTLWINPPATPYTPALEAWCQSSAQHLVITTKQVSEVIWSAEQALKSGAVAVVMIWLPNVSSEDTRRLQRAVQGNHLGIVFTSIMDAEARAYQTRLRMQLHAGELSWQVIKRRAGWPLNLDAEAIPIRYSPVSVSHQLTS